MTPQRRFGPRMPVVGVVGEVFDACLYSVTGHLYCDRPTFPEIPGDLVSRRPRGDAGEASVVHVGRGPGNLAKRPCLERAGHAGSPFVGQTSGSPRDASVVELLVREIRADVATVTAGLSAE